MEVKYHKAWKAREDILIHINGTHEESLAYLPKYCEDLDVANPGSLIALERIVEDKFQRIFLCLNAST